jgi:CheY-like chemotaxis protein
MTPSTRILVVDDDLDDQIHIKQLFIELDPSIHIDAVLHGKDALEFLNDCKQDHLPCIIITDLRMPKLSGTELIYLLHKDPRFTAIPKIVWSQSNQYADILESIRNGALKYFVKTRNEEKSRQMVIDMLELCGISAPRKNED